VGLVKGYQTKFQLYTVPGQVFYDSTRKLVLKGADGIIFVADSQVMMERPNLDSMENLKTNLASHKLDINEIPMVFQYNKRDLGNVFSIEELNKILNPRHLPSFGSVATEGKGVLEALRAISSLILGKIKHLLDQDEEDLAAMPPVEFATNNKSKIIDREKLPYKKIQTDSFEAISKQINYKDTEMKAIDEIKDKYPEENLKVETVEEIEDLKDIMFNQEPMEPGDINVPNVPEIDELNDDEEDLLGKTVVETDVDPSEFRAMEEIVEKEIKKEKEPEKEIEIEMENEPFKGLHDIPIDIDDEAGAAKIELGEPLEEEIEELEEIGELVEEGDIKKTAEAQKDANRPDDTKDAEPFKLEEEVNLDINEPPFKELEDVKEVEKIKEVKKVEKPGTVKPVQEARKIKEFKKTLKKEEKNKEDKKTPIIQKGMDLFEQLKDKTRLTVIREVPVKGPDGQLLIDIKDSDSNLLESVKVKITPEIKKITLILDVKK
jgi:GTPase SAR1 family protein